MAAAAPLTAEPRAPAEPARRASYEPHIDGLRAIAVVAVMLFHFRLTWVPGGFVGVDVFFVISGYLIAGIIVRALDEGRFSLIGFYERRVRRIFPALFVTMVAVLTVATLIFLPIQYRDLPATMVATLGFVSNFLFFTHRGYFASPTRLQPLAHTWSLGIEEQFYLLFPLFLILLHRRGRRAMFAGIAALALASFATSAWTAYSAPSFAFWMTPSRAWELMAGALLALAPSKFRQRWLREGLAAAGLVAIAVAMLFFSSKTPVPGFAALLPVLGSAAVLACGAGTMAGRLLSLKPAVGIGLISYSLYLWHWPITVFYFYFYAIGASRGSVIGMTVATFLLAILSWRYVEQPFRRRVDGRPEIGRLWRRAGVGAATILVLSGAAAATNGWPSRFPAEAVRIADYTHSHNPRRDECHEKLGSCSFGAPVPARYALWGDSHGIELIAALGEVAARHNASIEEYTWGGCLPALGDFRSETPECDRFKHQAIAKLEGDRGITTVILVGNYDAVEYRDNARLLRGLTESVTRLQRTGKRIVLAFPNPNFRFDLTIMAAEAIAYGRDRELGTLSKTFFDRDRTTLDFLERVGGPAVVRIRSDRLLCPGERCLTWLGRDLIARDVSHLTMPGARYVARLYEPLFAEGQLTTPER